MEGETVHEKSHSCQPWEVTYSVTEFGKVKDQDQLLRAGTYVLYIWASA